MTRYLLLSRVRNSLGTVNDWEMFDTEQGATLALQRLRQQYQQVPSGWQAAVNSKQLLAASVLKVEEVAG